jgi:hypothetical protein
MLATALAGAGAAVAGAQQEDATEPIRCWWRTSAGAVAVGEPFAASITCAVRADEAIDVVLDESRLPAAVIQLAPFEILDGSHPADLRTATHRFLQYHYTLRVISRDAIDRDIAFPDIHLSYRVQTRAGGDTVDGRDRTYVLPGQSVRLLSLVPIAADDIRDSADQSFARVEALRFRARALELTALALVALGLIVAGPAVLRLVRRPLPHEHLRPSGPHASHVLASVTRTLDEITRQKAGGWTPELVARALAAARLTAAITLGRGVSRRPHVHGRDVPLERLLVRRGLFRRTETTVATPVTPADLDRALAALPLTAPAERRQGLEDLRAALAAFSTAVYGPTFEPDDAALDEALAAAQRSTTRARQAHRWLRSLTRPQQAAGHR